MNELHLFLVVCATLVLRGLAIGVAVGIGVIAAIAGFVTLVCLAIAFWIVSVGVWQGFSSKVRADWRAARARRINRD